MKIKHLILLFLLISNVTWASKLNLIPYPQEVEFLDGQFNLKKKLTFNFEGQIEDTVCYSQLASELIKKCKTELSLTKSKTAHILLKLSSNNNKIGDEGYVLKVLPKQIIIEAKTLTGLFYGTQTLKQLIRTAENKSIGCVKIIDWPEFNFRGVMDDISRGPVPNFEFMKEQIRRMSEHKLNVLTYYTEHIIKTKSHPEFAPAQGGIDLDEWKLLSDYATLHHMQLMPGMQSLGHFEEILAHPKYAPLGETHGMLAPNKPEGIQFLNDTYSEIIPYFNSPYFNAYGDETWDLGRGASKAMADSLGKGTVYAMHMQKVYDIIKANKKTMLLTSDVPTKYPEIFEQLPKDIIMQAWDYADKDDFSHWIDPIKKHGFQFLVLPGVLNSNKTLPNYNISFANIRKFIAYGKKEGAIGILLTIWDDGGRHSFNRDWYGVAYSAEHSWKPNNYKVSDFDTRFNRAVYNDSTNCRTTTIHELNSLADFSDTYGMNNLIFWDKLIPERGKRATIDISNWGAIGEIAENTLNLASDYNKTGYYDYDLPFLNYTSKQYQYMAKARVLLTGAAENYKTACINQYTTPDIAKTNLADSKQKINEAFELFNQLKNEITLLWKQENRPYWTNYALDPFNETIADYTDLIQSFSWAEQLFESHMNLPTPLDIRLEIATTKGQYFRFWLITNPAFHITSPTDPIPDFLSPMGGESEAKPIPGFSFDGSDGQEHRFTKYYSPNYAEIDFTDYYFKHDEAVTYAYCTIESAEDRTVRATFGSNDGIEMFCNGESVFKIREKRGVLADENECLLNLKKGKNSILLKVDQWKGGWGFTFRLPDVEIRNHKQKYRIINE